MAAVLRAPGKLCSFSYVLFVFLLFYVLDVVSITVYDRDTLLNIGSSVAQRKPDFEFLNAGGSHLCIPRLLWFVFYFLGLALFYFYFIYIWGFYLKKKNSI